MPLDRLLTAVTSWLGVLILFVTAAAPAAATEVRIGVLANNGRAAAVQAWQPHADYLERALPGYQFRIVPLDFTGLYPAVKKGVVDFVVVNTGQYVELEAEAGITRIVTLKKLGPEGAQTVFGGVLFTRAERDDIEGLRDLRGKRIWIPDITSFGGWLMQLREILAAGVSQTSFAELHATGNHEAVVQAVLERHADIGSVRTGTLEEMAAAGLLDLSSLKIINKRQTPGFPLIHSTRLYPEWSFSKLRHTDSRLAERLAVALLQLPAAHPAARTAQITGWTIAADYTNAHELYRELQLGPYQGLNRFSLFDAVKRYWYLAVLTLVFMALLVATVIRVIRGNRCLAVTLQELEQQRSMAQQALEDLNERSDQLERTNEELRSSNERLVAINFERSQLLTALQKSEDQLRLLLDSTAEAIYGTDLNGTCTFCNTTCLTLLGYEKPEELIGKNIHQKIHYRRKDGSPYPEHECTIFKAFMRGEGLHVEEEVFWRSDGSSVTVEFWSYPQYRNGVIVGTVATFMDISPRIEAQKKLVMLSKAIENSPAAVVVTDYFGTIEYVNPKFTEITGYLPEEAIGQNPRILNAGVQSREFYAELWDTINSGREWRGEFCNRKKTGEIHWESASISPIRNELGQISHYVAVKEDITERKLIAEELHRAKEAAEAGNRSKSEFLANMSHEIRTPLNAILGFSDLALETELNPEQRDYLTRVNFAGTSLLRIINDILDLSKIEAGQLELEQIGFGPAELLQNTLALFREQAEVKGIFLKLDLDPTLPQRLQGDPLRLGQILTNLIGNAVKFTEQGGVEVRLSLLLHQPERVELQFEISDSGIGLTPESLTGLFQPFTQADNSITRKFGGTGLGLSICKRLVDLMGGSIWAESRLGEGSSFFFTLPFACAAAAVMPTVPRAARDDDAADGGTEDHLQGLRILLAEDNEVNCLLITELLRRRGIEVEVVTDGAQAVSRLLQTSATYDLVLMDIQMPVLDGLEATRRIRRDPRFAELPIIAVTAHAYQEEQDRCREAGMNAHIVKPVNAQIMFSTIEQWLQPSGRPARHAVALPVDEGRLHEIVRRLYRYIREQDGQAAYFLQECRHELAVLSEQTVASLEGLLSSYDYDAALEVLPEIAGMMALDIHNDGSGEAAS
ncbi:PhnD/SsuA/transferrin family substrate-binding protein [Trichlorobacter ammonificans]|uniref:histidine kinase n=1 Tax=Trichlorobacter ammonificans TaxID=2916410 RepID=A0ABN8HL24_9BACT|nr:PhnD/SsuA/transferrin family substrate-binding protein [Trichlorobacter ammonificans]CAH2032009.1 Histidine kinase [Trichlorobacter ammonificans]